MDKIAPVPITRNYSVNILDSRREMVLRKLERDGFIKTQVKESVECNKCDANIPSKSNSIERQVTCWNCHKLVSKKIVSERFIESIRYDTIISGIESILDQSGIRYQYNSLKRCWFADVGGKHIPILVADVPYSNFVLACSEGLGTLFILLDRRRVLPLINSLNEFQFVDFQILQENPSLIAESLRGISNTFDQNYSIDMETKFDSSIEKMSYVEFEKFCTEFLNAIKNRQNELASFYTYLAQRKNTIVNSKIIRLGGAGNPDFKIISLLDYIESALKPDKFGDAKKYKTTRLKIDQYSIDVALHSKGKDTLFIVSTNDIQIEVWKNVLESKSGNHYRYTILDKDLILTLIKCLKLEDLIS